MNRFKLFGAVAFFVFAVASGYMLGARSWDGSIYVTDMSFGANPRNPAAIKKELDFSRLDGADLITATQKRLVTAAKVIDELADTGSLGIELGHFVVRDEEGHRRLACDAFYDRIELRFEAEGITESGETAAMEIDGPCRASEGDISSIEPIWIPVAKIMSEEPVDMDLSYDEAVKFRFKNMTSSWPKRWRLSAVRLYNTVNETIEVKISARELYKIRETPLVLKWQLGRIPAKAE